MRDKMGMGSGLPAVPHGEVRMECNVKLTHREKAAYGLGDLGNNIAYGAVGFYFVFFLTDVAGLSPVLAGGIFLVVRIWNAICDLLTGAVSDRIRSRLGRRRPFLLYGAVPLAVGFALLWMVPFKGDLALAAYYTLAGILFNTLYSLVSIPYNALLPELTRDPDERTSLSAWKMAFSFVGSLLSAMGVTWIVDTLYPGRTQYPKSFPVMGQILGVMLAISILLSFAGTRERVTVADDAKPERLRDSLLSLLRLPAYRSVLGMFLCNMVAFDVVMALYIYYMKHALLLSEDLSSVFMAIPLVAAVVATPLWVAVSNRIGKRKAYVVSALYFMVPLLSCLLLPAGSIAPVVAAVVLIGVGISASQVLVFAILPDVVEIDARHNGKPREGVIYGVTMLLYKMGSAVTVAVVTAALGWFGYVEAAPGTTVVQSPVAVLGIRVLMGVVPAACLLLSVWFVSRFGRESACDGTVAAAVGRGHAE